MNYLEKDDVYNRIHQKIESGIFKKGQNCEITRYYFDDDTIEAVPFSLRTPEVCSSFMAYGRCHLYDVPEVSMTKEFFIATYTNKEVFEYIQDHISDFDREFFKDLIATNEYATSFDTNCFSIMPLEYIDEEMCSLAILSSLNWSDDDWFYTVQKRKPEALTADLWKLGARLYARMSGENNPFLDITPEEYRDAEYYKEMCSCNFNCGVKLEDNKGKIMDSIPEEVITADFLVELLVMDMDSISVFSEKALETEIAYSKYGKMVSDKIWKFIVRKNGNLIRYIPLNDERIEFFLQYYDKDSSEYTFYFKDRYKNYKKQKENAESLNRVQQRMQERMLDIGKSTLLNAYLYSIEGENPSKAIEEMVDKKESMDSSFLPIYLHGIVPAEFCKTHDTEEYLEMMYTTFGITIVEEYDDLFYKVILPEGWSIENNGYWNDVKESNGNTVIEYFYDSKFYDRDAYVSRIEIPEKVKTYKNK